MHIAHSRTQPFAYGRHDCAQFAAGAVLAMTGTDLAARVRSAYTTRTGGLKALKRHGFDDHLAFVREELTEIPVARARHGDIAVVESANGYSLGVVGGSFVLAPAEPGGLAAVPLLATTAGGHILAAFRV